MEYYNLEIKDVLKNLRTELSGLTTKEAKSRLKKYGLNEIKKTKKFSTLKIFLRQFLDPLIIILVVATLISSFFLKEYLEAIAISIILILNALLGFSQEYKAEKAIELLKKLTPLKSKVVRDWINTKIDSKELVPGDVILVEAGDKISADARIIETNNLLVDESILTGESTPIEKVSDAIKKEKISIMDQVNMLFSGSMIASGKAKAVITATNMNTEIGKIAYLVETTKETKTPLQKKLTKLGKLLGIITLIICLFLFVFGIIQGIKFYNMFLIALSLVVSVIPEGLPAVITITLALAVRTMFKQKALIRKLKAIETLGSVTFICTDKTGTITKNEMTVTEVFVNNKNIVVTGKGYETKGNFLYKNKKISPKSFELLLQIGASCNNATLPNFGDPTELALLVSAYKSGIKEKLEKISEIPFNPIHKYMLTAHKINNKTISFLKGAPEKILQLCDFIKINNSVRRLTKREKELILKENKEMANKTLRVLAMAYKEDKKTIFVGLQGMIDPPRKEVKQAIELCKKAGIEVVMITGDNISTAKAIAKQIGIKDKAIDGKELEKINDKELEKLIKKVGVFARVNPEHKVRILKALQKNNEIVAMTGDGINDAPALKRADVGISMFIKGTDVAREASDIVLVDDNFDSIVKAVREGRIVYDNIKKFIKFMLSVNFDEIFLILFAIIARLPLPLLPLQILWMNLISDSLPALALSKEHGEKNIMERKPRNPKEGILSGTFYYILAAGVVAFIITLTIFLLEYFSTGNIDKARTLALTTTLMFEMFFVFSCRSDRCAFQTGLFSNRYLIGAVLITILLQVIAIYTPLNVIFRLIPLGLKDWLLILSLSSIGFIFFEVKKLLKK